MWQHEPVLPLHLRHEWQADRVGIVDPDANQADVTGRWELHLDKVGVDLLICDRIDDGYRPAYP
jgi:hypothetical protein